jgi:hypothetical protein
MGNKMKFKKIKNKIFKTGTVNTTTLEGIAKASAQPVVEERVDTSTLAGIEKASKAKKK